MNNMLHMTLNTGHVCESPRSGVGSDIIEYIREEIDHHRTSKMPCEFPDETSLRLISETSDRATYMLSYREHEAIYCDLYKTQDSLNAVWPKIATCVYECPEEDSQHRAPQMPLLIVSFLPGMMQLPFEVARKMGDMERCVAWSLMPDAQQL